MNPKFLLLRFLYVKTTKTLLLWLLEQGPKTRQEIEAAWMETIRNEKELELMLRLLVKYGTAEEKEGLIGVTKQGRAFLEWLGWTERR